MRKLILILFFFLPLVCLAQYQPSNDIFPSFGNYERKGWLISPELTYMLRPIKNNQKRIWLGSDTVYDVEYRAEGKVGVGLELGRFYAIENSRLISYVDFAIGFKMLRGVERFEAALDDPDRTNPYLVSGQGTFSQSYATASFNATNSIVLTDKMFLNNTLGINGDFRFAESYTYNNGGIAMEIMNPSRFIFQAHYSIGLGFIVSRNMMLIPSVETPLMTFYQFDDLKSTLGIFNSRYRPLIFRLTVMLLDNKANRKCPQKVRSSKKTTLFGDAKNRPW